MYCSSIRTAGKILGAIDAISRKKKDVTSNVFEKLAQQCEPLDLQTRFKVPQNINITTKSHTKPKMPQKDVLCKNCTEPCELENMINVPLKLINKFSNRFNQILKSSQFSSMNSLYSEPVQFQIKRIPSQLGQTMKTNYIEKEKFLSQNVLVCEKCYLQAAAQSPFGGYIIPKHFEGLLGTQNLQPEKINRQRQITMLSTKSIGRPQSAISLKSKVRKEKNLKGKKKAIRPQSATQVIKDRGLMQSDLEKDRKELLKLELCLQKKKKLKKVSYTVSDKNMNNYKQLQKEVEQQMEIAKLAAQFIPQTQIPKLQLPTTQVKEPTIKSKQQIYKSIYENSTFQAVQNLKKDKYIEIYGDNKFMGSNALKNFQRSQRSQSSLASRGTKSKRLISQNSQNLDISDDFQAQDYQQLF